MQNKIIGSASAASSVAKSSDWFMDDIDIPRRVVVFKVFCDLLFSLLALPLILICMIVLTMINPIFNPGPLFFSQERMGKNQARFVMWKFRTMLPEASLERAHDAAVEQSRITTLGRFLRKSRIDELPNFFNVMLGQMSVIGPRPDMFSHSVEYIKSVPHYKERFRLRPGISGFAQVRNGYADSGETIRRKARLDRIYVENFNIRLELYVILSTFRVMLTGNGAK